MSEHDRPTREELLAHEDDILRGLLAAARYKEDQQVTITISRKGARLFSFRIRPLSEDEYNECRERASSYEANPRLGGIRMPVAVDTAKYRSLLIYTATVSEDRAALWDNKAIWEELNVVSGWQVIDKVLLAGEKDAILAKLDEISGYGTSLSLEEVAKN